MRHTWSRHGWLAAPAVALALLVWFAQPPAVAQSRSPGESWECSVDDIGASLTLCEPAHDGYRLYLTDVVMQSTTTTVGQALIRYGTGSACGTGTVSLLPSAAAVPRLAYTPSTAAPTVISLRTPVSAPRNTDICIICTATQTCTAQLTGFAAP